MQKGIYKQLAVLSMLSIILFSSCGKSVNTVQDPHFDKSGNCLDSLIKASFSEKMPSKLGFYVEVSGSMNGFFRSNQTNEFKEDVWSIVSNFGNSEVSVLSNAGTIAGTYSIAQFRLKMNSGGFVSNRETLVPTMIHTILNNLDYKNGACAVLISDMKYSPEQQKDIKILLTQYQADIRNEIGKHPGIAISIVLAKSKYLNANGTIAEPESPYYYVIFGQDENVAFMRNYISALLEDNGDYIESIETGFDYKSPAYSFGVPDNAIQLFDQPTFTNYDVNYSDTCTVRIKLDVSNFRWKITNKEIFGELISAKALYGSQVKVDNIKIDVNNHYNKEFKRRAIAEFDLKIYNMFATESDVIEWTLNHPDYTISSQFEQIISTTEERDLAGSFSMDKFIGGSFNAIQNKWDSTPNRILISKVRQ